MGWAEGLQSGLALGRAFKEGQERRKMEEIQNAAPTEMRDYSPSQTQQIRGLQDTNAYDVQAIPGAEGTAPTLRYTPKQGLDLQGDTPAPAGAYIDVAPQRMTEFLGQRYEGGLTPDRMEALRTRAMAGAVADPRLRQQMLMEATRAEREAQEAPLRQKALEQQVGLGGVQLTAAQRAEKMLANNEAAQNALAELRSTNQPVTSQTLAQLAKTHGADYNTLLSSELNQLGFNEKTAAVEMKNLSRDWSKAVLGGAPQINKFLADKFDPDKTDNTTPELVQTKAGYVVKYGDKILGEYGTHKDLSTLAAQVHGMINDDPLGTLRTLASVKASNATAAYQEAHAGLIPAQARLLGAQADYYNKREPTGKDKITAKIEEFKAAFKREPTEREMSQMFGLMAKDTGKPEPEMTKAQSKAWELLQKSDMWQQLERKNDVAGMNKLLVGRGIDPGLIGLPGDAGWVAKPTTAAAAAAAAAPAAAPVMQQGLYPGDEDWRSVPTRPMQQGIATLDATKLLRTPKYSANTSSPNFRD
jgi:hypothetical protein